MFPLEDQSFRNTEPFLILVVEKKKEKALQCLVLFLWGKKIGANWRIFEIDAGIDLEAEVEEIWVKTYRWLDSL